VRRLFLIIALAPSCGLWVSDDDLCDSEVDRVRWFPDADGDGFGDALAAGSCAALDGFVDNAEDCDDRDPAFTSLAAMGDVGGRTLWYPDADNDGAGADRDPVRACAPPDGFGAPAADDCDDENPSFSVVCPWTDVAVAINTACGLRSDGSISCWGDTALASAERLPREGAIAIAGGDSVMCGLYDDDEVVCTGLGWNYSAPDANLVDGNHRMSCAWRIDGTYVCDDNGYTNWHDVDPPVGPVTDLTIGEDHACAVMADSTLHCWGNDSGFNIDPPGGDGWLNVQSGRFFACAGHETAGVTCWGHDPLKNAFEDVPDGIMVELAGGGYQTCALDEDGLAACWGVNELWSTPPAIDEPAVAIDASHWHGCLVTVSGHMKCWGANSRGQATPPSLEQRGVALGGNVSCAIRSGGRVSCWGDAPELKHAHTAVFVGHDRAASITAVGELLFWGPDDPDLDEDHAQRSYETLRGYSSRATADESICLLDVDGGIHCWSGSFARDAYADVPESDGFIDVAPGALHGCALDASGTPRCWSHDVVVDRIVGTPKEPGFVEM
jgi:hypothetical protein